MTVSPPEQRSIVGRARRIAVIVVIVSLSITALCHLAIAVSAAALLCALVLIWTDWRGSPIWAGSTPSGCSRSSP
ncbi:MAG: hypothetical protein H7146_05485 [Burkholderiaceae bacterium]|nr:hypothetical protein [Microbacteriaceae bacterium]